MKRFIETDPHELTGNVFRLIGRDLVLVTAGKERSFNTMTASWGGLGVLWNAPVSMIFVRPSRYTYEFIEREAGIFPPPSSGRMTGGRCRFAVPNPAGTSTR